MNCNIYFSFAKQLIIHYALCLKETGMPEHLSVTDVMFGFCNGREKQKKYINRLLIIGKSCISKFKYGKHPHVLYLFRNELNLRN